jgi:mRNA-degrading endonuclease RelE of RelBE toxin-antitoxin system
LATIVLTGRAREEVTDLPVEVLDDLDEAMMRIAADPSGAGYPLRGRLHGKRSYRVRRNYRVIFALDAKNDQRVNVLSVRHRSREYDDL